MHERKIDQNRILNPTRHKYDKVVFDLKNESSKCVSISKSEIQFQIESTSNKVTNSLNEFTSNQLNTDIQQMVFS